MVRHPITVSPVMYVVHSECGHCITGKNAFTVVHVVFIEALTFTLYALTITLSIQLLSLHCWELMKLHGCPPGFPMVPVKHEYMAGWSYVTAGIYYMSPVIGPLSTVICDI